MNFKALLTHPNVPTVAAALGIPASQLKLALVGPKPNPDQESIRKLVSIDEVLKAWNRAQSPHRKFAVIEQGVEIAKSPHDFSRLFTRLSGDFYGDTGDIENLKARAQKKYRHIMAEFVETAHIDKLLEFDHVDNEFCTREITLLHERGLLHRVSDFALAVKAFHKYSAQLYSDLWSPYLIKAIELGNKAEIKHLIETVFERKEAWFDPQTPVCRLIAIKLLAFESQK